jgi:PA14 domain-containing protein
VQAVASGNSTFGTVSDDGVRLWVNGQLVIDNWTDHGTTTNTSGPITLTAGTRYAITMEFYERGGAGDGEALVGLSRPNADRHPAVAALPVSRLKSV